MTQSKNHQPARSGSALIYRWRNPIALAVLLLLAGAVAMFLLAKPIGAQSVSITVSPSSLSVSEGGSANLSVSLSGTPGGEVSVSVASSDASAVKPAFAYALFTPDHTGPYTIPILGLADYDADGETVTLTLTATGGATATVTVSVTDTGARTLDAPTLSMRTTTPVMAPGSVEGDLNWTTSYPKKCSIDSYEIHYKKNSVSDWPSTSDTADADSGVHTISLESQHHGADVLWTWVKLGVGSQPALDAVTYDIRVRVDGANCTEPSAFSSTQQATPMQGPSQPPTPSDGFDGQTLAIEHVSSAATGCLDVSYGNATNGQDVWVWACNESDAQKWTFEKRTTGAYKDSYRLVSSLGDGTYCLDNRGDFATSDRMGIWRCVDDNHWAAANQSVAIEAVGSGYTLTFNRVGDNKSVWLTTDRASDSQYGAANQTTVSGIAGPNAIWSISSD